MMVRDFSISVADAEQVLRMPSGVIRAGNMARTILPDGRVTVSAIDLANALGSRGRSASTIFRQLEAWQVAQ